MLQKRHDNEDSNHEYPGQCRRQVCGSVDQCIAEVDRIVRRIRRKDTEIGKSQKRTRAMLTELAARR